MHIYIGGGSYFNVSINWTSLCGLCYLAEIDSRRSTNPSSYIIADILTHQSNAVILNKSMSDAIAASVVISECSVTVFGDDMITLFSYEKLFLTLMICVAFSFV